MNAKRAKIAPFPGAACDYHRSGRCLYEERLNPGLDASWRCAALAACEAAFDGFLTQADNFGLSDVRAVAIWKTRFAGLTEKRPDCGRFEPDQEGGYPGCVHLDRDVCLMRLPKCPGVCPNYRPAKREAAINPNQSDGHA
ncbi:MAG: hypothetical protein HQK81_07455 [Desulfovibrionaceae bacterium]|nr:hypothetical protein [Desulfovibrionaceae bacterium]MBF0513886.1 hypothetical protein [Desulfovibrionaceae bacterium]